MMNRYYQVICYILIGFPLVTVESIVADTTNAEAYIKLTNEIRNIVDRNQANFDSVNSIQGRIDTRTTVSYGDKGSRVREHIEEIWCDGGHFRSDTLEDKFTGQETEPLLIDRDSDGREIFLGTRPAGHVHIESIESGLEYFPDAGSVTIRPSMWDSDKRNMNKLLHYQSYWGDTLKEIIMKMAQRGSYFTVRSEKMGTDECLLLENDYSDAKTGFRIWVVPSKGYCIRRLQSFYRGRITQEYTTTLREYLPGIWWFNSVRSRIAAVKQAGRPEKIVELSVSSLQLNEPINPKTFTLEGTNIPHGTKVRDNITGRRYRHVNIPSPPSLIGRSLPEFKDFRIELSTAGMDERSILLCLFDMNQRPSRNCLRQLSKRANQFKARDVCIVAVHASRVDEAAVNEWTQENSISFPVGLVEGDAEKVCLTWGVRSLPWLILTDERHIVTAEGFGLSELAGKIAQIDGD